MNRPMPAFANSASIRPNFRLISSIATAISGTRDTSALITRASGPSSVWATFKVRSLRPVMATRAPSRMNALAVASPMPLLPPVTTATLSLNLPLIVASSRRGVGGMSARSRSVGVRSRVSRIELCPARLLRCLHAMPSRLGCCGERQGCQETAMLPFGFAGEKSLGGLTNKLGDLKGAVATAP
jgi:hypothetical protein